LVRLLSIACCAFVLVLGVHGNSYGQQESSIATETAETSLDWVRGGLVFGPDYTEELGFRLGAKVALFGITFTKLYVVPVSVTVLSSLEGLLDFAAYAETGWLGRWGENRLLVGIGVGYGVEKINAGGQFFQGVTLRPVAKYRRYCKRLGIEVFLELPLVLDPAGIDRKDVVRGWLPLVGFSLGW
jgi:hypothetical protein